MRLRFNNFGQKQKKTEEKLFGFSKSIFVVVVEFQFRWFVFLLDYFNISMTLLGINQNKWAISSRARPIQTHTTNRTRNYFECVFNLVAFYIFRAVTLSLSLLVSFAFVTFVIWWAAINMALSDGCTVQCSSHWTK